MRDGGIGVVLGKEVLLGAQSLAHGELAVDVSLAPVHDADALKLVNTRGVARRVDLAPLSTSLSLLN